MRTDNLQDGPGDTAVSHAPEPERQLLSAEISDHVAAALAGLTALERAAFMLRHMEGRSIAEVCAGLGLKPQAAKHSVFRAVKKMRVALEPLVQGPAKDAAQAAGR